MTHTLPMGNAQENKTVRLPRQRVCPKCNTPSGRDEAVCHECAADIDSVRPRSVSPPNPTLLAAKDKKRLNRFVCGVSSQNRRVGDGVGDIVEFLKNEGLTTEEFILCGREGKANFPLVRGNTEIKNTLLCIGWYEGRLEFAYLS